MLSTRSSPGSVHQVGESHYELLRAFADDRVLDHVRVAIEERGYRAHEFGDSLLIERQGAPGVLRASAVEGQI
jgi:S-adenosylmethionine:tRNA ribosyltransferase-isomerase